MDDPSSDRITSQDLGESDDPDIENYRGAESQVSIDNESDTESSLSVGSDDSLDACRSESSSSLSMSRVLDNALSLSSTGDSETDSDVLADDVLGAEPATVIIGPRYGHNPGPPIGLYVTEGDLGGWMDLEEKGKKDGAVYAPQKTLEGQSEELFDETQDCILIPFDGY